MIWKKNAISCLVWAVYLLMAGTAMVFTGRVICDSFGMAEYFEFMIPAAYLLFAGVMVFMLHRMAVKLDAGSGRAGKGLVWLEGIIVLGLFAVGIFLRVTELQPESLAVPEDPGYLKLAYVSADGQGVPQFSHGAIYLYVCLLRLCFILLGNKAAAAVWLQIVLQMFSVLLLHFAVRKMAGRIPAVMMVSFFMLSPYMVKKPLTISPEMIYLMLFSLVLSFISQGVKYVPGWGFWLMAGVMSAVLCYLDVAGFLLLPLIFGIITMRRQDAGRMIVRGLFGSLTGFLLGAAGCVFADMAGSGKPVAGIIRAWGDLYWRGDLQLSIKISSFDTMWLITLILCFMAWGIFSFWCSRGVERFTIWIVCLCSAVLMQCLGMFTEEMSGFCHIFFFSTILAGLGIRESITVYPAESKPIIKEEKEIVEDKDKTEKRDSAETVSEGENTGAEKVSEGESIEAEKVSEEKGVEKGEQPEKERKIEFLENPLPLPKKHAKRVMDYKLDSDKDLGGYDVFVADDDDFDH